MSFTPLWPLAAAALLALAATASQAGVLFSQAPVAGIDGIQADDSTDPLSQSFTVAAGATLESIEWYGYHLLVGEISDGIFLGPTFDLFTVTVNGTDVSTGVTLVKQVVDAVGDFDLYKYTLDIADTAVSSGSLVLANGPDTQWAWQYGGPGDPPLTAFTLNGTVNGIPEPQTYALMLLGLAAVAGVTRRRRSQT